MNDGPIVRRATPRAVLLDPLRNEWLDMGWQILQRVRPTNPGEIAEFHQRLNGLPDGALRGLPLAKPVGRNDQSRSRASGLGCGRQSVGEHSNVPAWITSSLENGRRRHLARSAVTMCPSLTSGVTDPVIVPCALEMTGVASVCSSAL